VQADLARTYGVSQATISRLTGDRPWVSLRCGDRACPERLSHCVRLRAAMKSLPPRRQRGAGTMRRLIPRTRLAPRTRLVRESA
jgi:hypothetical protein